MSASARFDATARSRRKARRGARGKARWKAILSWSCLVLLAAGLSISVAEIALRLLFREEEVGGNYWGAGAFEADAETGYRHAAGFRGYAYRRGAFESWVEIGPHNLRQASYAEQLRQPRRLLILGDSYVFGLGVREEEIFATLLEGPLNDEGIGVINAGQSGYSPVQEVAFGLRLAEQTRPDAILLLLFPGNDPEGDYYASYANVELVSGHRLPKDRWLPWAPVDSLRTHSYLLAYLEGRHSRSAAVRRYVAFQDLGRERPGEAIRPTLEALERLRDQCAARGIALGIALVPSKEGGGVFDAPLRSALAAAGFSLLDLADAGITPEDYFDDDWHWNARGHARVAEHLRAFALALSRAAPS